MNIIFIIIALMMLADLGLISFVLAMPILVLTLPFLVMTTIILK